MESIVRAASAAEIAAAATRSQLVNSIHQQPIGGATEPKVYRLQVPISICGQVHEEVPLRRLKGKDIIALSNITGDESLALLAIITNLPVEAIGELDGDDFMGLSEAAQDFLPRALRTGGDTTSGAGLNSPPPSPEASDGAELN